jgi:hypothetical protein
MGTTVMQLANIVAFKLWAAGRVEGVLWYFPFENDRETVPLDPHTLGRMMLTSHRDGATQAVGAHGACDHPAWGGGGQCQGCM